MPAELDDTRLERQARAGRGLLEDERDDRAAQRVRRARRRLELLRAVQQRDEVVAAELFTG
jgi:hypothetical protein